MCEISTHLKLCTCSTKGVAQLKNYWTLHRSDGRHFMTIGEIVPPRHLASNIHKLNKETLLHLLNESNCFDFDFKPESNDKLLLNFLFKAEKSKTNTDESLTYAFIYKNSKWVSYKYDPFEISFTTINEGKISNPFK